MGSFRHFRAGALPALLAAILGLGLGGCGDEEPQAGDPLDFETWKVRAASYCSDGIQEGVALPLPSNDRQLAADAAQRAEILLTVRDAVLPLGAPDGKGPQVGAYVGALTEDADLLNRISETAANGVDPAGLESALIEANSGEAARELELEECANLANVIARTP